MARITGLLAAVLSVGFFLTSCTPHTQYRDNGQCVSQTAVPNADCEQHALQYLPTDNGAQYLLGFIEFDDQGQLWDRQQMRTVLDTVYEQTAKKDILLVSFVHGWKHSAAPGDSNIETFRRFLAKLSDTEQFVARTTGSQPRLVTGIYLGWRGGSLTVPYLENITFWDRKNTAEKVGHGGVTEVLSHLEDVKRTRDSMVCRADDGVGGADCESSTRLITLGHSFGGAIVHTALAQILENRFIQTKGPAGQKSDVQGFGNLVVLINPAFEANLYTPLSDMSTERGFYTADQRPVLLILTSEADLATKIAFPAGRRLSTMFEKSNSQHVRRNAASGELESIDEQRANRTAVGHFEPYRTHHLAPKAVQKREAVQSASAAESVRTFVQASDGWKNDTKGSRLEFGAVVLERTAGSAARNPYLVTSVDKNLIAGHNDIDDERIIEFVKQLVLFSSYENTELLRQSLFHEK